MDDAPLLQPQRSAASSSSAAAGPSKPLMTPAAPPSLRRKRLADISNLSMDRSAATSSSFTSTGKENPVSIAAATSTKDVYIAQLLKENNALIRALGERNKVIELSASEIKSVRCALQKLMQQNHQLAHANTLMLAERNQDKDKLKTLQHEVGCVQAALKAQKFELEEEKKLNRQLNARIGSEQVNLGCHSEMDFVVEDPAIPVAQNTSEEEKKLNRQLKARIGNEQVNLGCHSEMDFVVEDPATSVAQNTSEEEKKLNRQLKTRIGSEQVNLGCHSEMNFVVEDPAIPVPQNTSEEEKKLNRQLKARIGSEQVNLGCHSEMDFVMEDPAIPVVQNMSEPVTVDANVDARPELDLIMEDPPVRKAQKKAPSTNRKRSTRSQPPSVTDHQDGVKENDVSSRRSSRRRATSLRNTLCVPNENLIVIEDINLSVVPQLIDDPMSRDSSNQAVPSAPSVSNVSTDLVTEERPKEPIGTLQVQIQKEPIKSQVQIQKEPIGTSQVQIQKEPVKSQVQIQEVRRLSVDRPTRRAKEKICYKEIPLNVKMRREN